MHLNVFVVILLLFSVSSHAKALRLCHEDQSYPPYIISNEQTTASSGLLIDILEHAASNANIELYFTSLPWKRCQQGVKTGLYDGLFAMIKTPQRENEFAYPENEKYYLNEVDYVILYKKDSLLHRAEIEGKLFNFKGEFNLDYYKKMKQFGLQAPAGYVLEQYIKQHKIAAQVDYDLDLGIHQVAIDRLDGYLVEKRIGLARTAALKQNDIVISSQGIIKRTYWYLPFNQAFFKQNKADVMHFWHHIELAREHILKSR